MSSTSFGYSGSSFDRFVGEQSAHQMQNTALNKMQHHFWVAKQTVLRRLGKKEDNCIVASDAELDAKLELFFSIQETCQNLYKILEVYQDRLHVLVLEESSMGHFLKEEGKNDKTRAGKMMVAVGKAMLYCSHQRVALRFPLVRLHQEVETFCQRAIEDTAFTVNEMEKSRNEYRGALLWMKNVSQGLNPDTYKELEKFRKVQSHVRDGKTKFDRHKLACLQKIDLLAAARCNMFSNGLIIYQNNLSSFWQRTAKALQTVADAFKGYQPYEFSVVAELRESSLKLADETNSSPDAELEFFFENEFRDENLEKTDGKKNTAEPKKPEMKPAVDPKTEKPSAVEDLLQLDQTDALLLELDQLGFGNSSPNPGKSFDLDQNLSSEAANENWTPFMACDWLESGKVTSSAQDNLLLADSEDDLLSMGAVGGDAAGQSKPLSMLQQIMNQAQTLKAGAVGSKENAKNPEKKPTQGKDVSWYNLFAELDPLANPDSFGANKQEDKDRNC